MVAADHFHGRLQRNRIHEVYTEHFRRAARDRCDTSNRDGGRVSCEYAALRANRIDLLVDLLLDFPLLSYVLYDEIDVCKPPHVSRELDALENVARITSLRRLFEEAFEAKALCDVSASAFEDRIGEVQQDN